MAQHYGPNIVTDGLVVSLDADIRTAKQFTDETTKKIREL
jgi:hypothetical protein